MNREPLNLDFWCQEKRGGLNRMVKEVPPSVLLEQYLAPYLEELPESLRNLEWMYKEGVRIFLVDRVGMLIQGPNWWEGLPDVHIIFWDRILRGREELCARMARLGAREAGVQGVWTAIPESARTTLAFARRVGFELSHVTEDRIAVMYMLFT